MVGSGVSLKMDGKTVVEVKKSWWWPRTESHKQEVVTTTACRACLMELLHKHAPGPTCRSSNDYRRCDRPAAIAVLYGEDTVHVTSKTLPRN